VYALTSEGAAALDQHASLVTTLLEQVRNRTTKKQVRPGLLSDADRRRKAVPGHHSQNCFYLEEKSMKEGG
jgi:hypothetical protein